MPRPMEGVASRLLAPAAYVARSRVLRGAFIGLVTSGIGLSIASPQLTLFLVKQVHLAPAQAGLYYVTNLASIVVGFAIGFVSDRVRSRLAVFRLCTTATALGWVAMAFAVQPWMPFVINVTLLSVAGAGAAQLQAVVREELDRHPTPLDHHVVAAIRMALAFGWILGPLIGAPLGAWMGLRAVLIITAVCIAAGMLPLIGVAIPPPHHHQAIPATGVRQEQPDNRRRSLGPLLAFTVIYVLTMCGETVKLAYLPLYLNDVLHVPAVVRGAVIGFQPLVEVALMPVAAAVAARRGVRFVLVVGAIAAVAAHLSYSSADLVRSHIEMLIVGQILMAATVAAFGVLGITVAQKLLPERIGLASTIYFSAYAINGALGGTIGSISIAWLGLPHMFLVSASVSACGLIGLIIFMAVHPVTGTVGRANAQRSRTNAASAS